MVEEVRREELAKTIKEDPRSPEKPLAKKNKPDINKSYVQMQLIEKDKKIQELAKMVQMYESGQKTPKTGTNI